MLKDRKLAAWLTALMAQWTSAVVRCSHCIGRVSYLIYISMRHYVLTTSGDIVVCFYTAVCLNC